MVMGLPESKGKLSILSWQRSHLDLVQRQEVELADRVVQAPACPFQKLTLLSQVTCPFLCGPRSHVKAHMDTGRAAAVRHGMS